MGMNFLYTVFTIILQLVFIGSLFILTIRIKSIGLGLISFTLLFGNLFRWIFYLIFTRFLFNQRKIGEIYSIDIYNFISNFGEWLITIFCIIGVLLILNEWNKGKFQSAQTENRYPPNP